MIEQNFIKLYENSFKKHWELNALSDYHADNLLTYGDLARSIARTHLLFEKMSLAKGDKIALVGKNHTSWATVFLSTITYGAVIVPILADFHPESIEHIINHSEAKLVFINKQIWENIDSQKINVPVFAIPSFELIKGENMDSEEIRKQVDNSFKIKYPEGFRKSDIRYPTIGNEEVICLNYTSGTTGFSKGVMLTANNFAGNITFAQRLKLLFPGERDLAFLPLAHAYGCAFDFLYALSQGVHVTLLGIPPTPRNLVEALQEVKPHIIITVPLILEKIYKKSIQPLLNKRIMKIILKIPVVKHMIYSQIKKNITHSLGGNFREVIIGGAALNKEVEDFFYAIGFPFTVGYGMTECAPLISYSPHQEFIPRSCGRVLKDIMQARIDSEDPENIPGEIQVRGENVMLGYYKNPEATSSAFTKDGWLKTGDSGVMDKNNCLYIKGRIKAMLLGPNGQNIFPEEIESRLNNLPYVAQSLVISRDGKLIALVFPDYLSLKEADIPREMLDNIMADNLNTLNKHLANYEKISKIEIMENDFEMTPKQSIKRFIYQ
jgi:long-chain acyl-CoA synthetase